MEEVVKRGSAGGKAMGIISRRKALLRYYENPNLCKNCNEIIMVKENEKVRMVRRKKFCDRSCAASYNNSKYPKRSKECQKYKRKNFKLLIKIHNKYTNCFGNKTKKEAFDGCKLWQTARNSIRRHAQKVYLKHTKQLVCEKCGYALHIEVCHLKPVSEFSDNAFIREINHISNLIGLCPNHHWELDNGYLKI